MQKYTQEELENIVKDYNNGYGLRPYQLAKKYNRRSSSIIQKLKSLNVFANYNYRFTKEDIEFLKEHYPSGDWNIIFKRFPNATKQSIMTKTSELGIYQENPNKWTDEEILILKENYKFGDIRQLTTLLPNHSYKAITTKAKRLNIKSRKLWTKDEDELLIKLYPIHHIDDILNKFPDRSRNSIIKRAIKLNLKSIDYNPWTQNEDDYIKEHWFLQPDVILANNLNRTPNAVQVRRLYLNCYRRDMDSTKYESLSKYIRGNIQQWKKDSMKNCNYQCIFTGSKDFQIHHLYGVSNILNDIVNNYHIVIKNNINDYSKDELQYILNIFIKEQSKYPLGVCIRKEIHVLFHSLYGQYYNTPEQWYQFQKDYTNGIYDDIIKNKIA